MNEILEEKAKRPKIRYKNGKPLYGPDRPPAAAAGRNARKPRKRVAAAKGKTKIKHTIRLPSGQQFQTPWQGAIAPPSANALGDGSVDGTGEGPVPILPGAMVAKHLLATLKDPWIPDTISRWPDEYTMIPTLTARDVTHSPMQIWNGGTSASPSADGSTAFYLRGDPRLTWRYPSSIDSSTSSTTPYEMKWNSTNNDMNTSLPSGAMARPTGIGSKFTYSGVGPFHTIVARIIEFPPYYAIAATDHPANFPLAANSSFTYIQREFLRAREVVMKPGDTLNILSLPANRAGLNFCLTSYERDNGTYSFVGASWSGFMVWFWGLYATDSMYVDTSFHHEYVLPQGATYPVAPGASRAIVKPAPEEVVNVDSELIDTASYGWNVFLTTVKAAIGVAKDIASLVPSISPTAFNPSMLGVSVMEGGPPLLASYDRLPKALRQEVLRLTSHETEQEERKTPLPVVREDGRKTAPPPPPSEEKEPFEDLSKSCLLKELKKRM